MVFQSRWGSTADPSEATGYKPVKNITVENREVRDREVDYPNEDDHTKNVSSALDKVDMK